MIEFLELHKIPPILAIFLVVLFFIILARIVFALLINIAKMVYGGSIKTAEFLKNDLKKFVKEDEEAR